MSTTFVIGGLHAETTRQLIAGGKIETPFIVRVKF